MAYEGFKKLRELVKKKGIRNPDALAASIARKKYGSKAVAQHSAAGTSMKTTKHLKGK